MNASSSIGLASGFGAGFSTIDDACVAPLVSKPPVVLASRILIFPSPVGTINSGPFSPVSIGPLTFLSFNPLAAYSIGLITNP